MGYYLQAFICRNADTVLLTERFDKAIAVALDQGVSLVPMTEELFDQINEQTQSTSIDNFVYMTVHIESRVLDAIGHAKVAYVEAEYFGGEGGQVAIVWNDGKRERISSFGQDKINGVLRSFGVIAKGEDEFITVGLDANRNTRDWISGDN